MCFYTSLFPFLFYHRLHPLLTEGKVSVPTCLADCHRLMQISAADTVQLYKKKCLLFVFWGNIYQVQIKWVTQQACSVFLWCHKKTPVGALSVQKRFICKLLKMDLQGFSPLILQTVGVNVVQSCSDNGPKKLDALIWFWKFNMGNYFLCA